MQGLKYHMGIQISGKQMVNILQQHGFIKISQRGSHVKMRKSEPSAIISIIVPDHKMLKPGTLHNILKRANIKKQDISK